MNSAQLGLFFGGVLVVLIGVILVMSRNQKVGKTDPLADAETYLAFGRKSQAIEILERASIAYPNRSDLKAKLRELKECP